MITMRNYLCEKMFWTKVGENKWVDEQDRVRGTGEDAEGYDSFWPDSFRDDLLKVCNAFGYDYKCVNRELSVKVGDYWYTDGEKVVCAIYKEKK